MRKPEPQRSQPLNLPAPIEGVNLYDSLAMMGQADSIFAYNLVPSEFGLRTRAGYEVWCDTLGGEDNAVRTLIPFEGETAGDDKLFATTVLGIYDVTSSADSPTIDTSFSTQSGNAGHGVFQAYNNDNGDHYLFYADEANGLYEYDPSAGTWAAASDITGVSEANIVFVTEHKNRIWFAEAGTADAWYLALGAKGGTATKFALGNKFRRGGHLKGMYKWSVDGGDGVDDLLVFISSAGEVAIYQGTDPSSASTWTHIGTWFLGQVPAGRKICENIGGELHILSAFGLISIQDLVSGVDVGKATGQNTIARKIARAIRTDMVTKTTDFEWDIVLIPTEGSAVVLRPYDTDATQLQYVFSFTRPGWGYWRGVPMNCGVEWKGVFYFGDDVGNVHTMEGSLDAVARDGTGGDPVAFSLLQAYSDLGAPGLNKLVHFIRPRFFSERGVPPSYAVKAFYDFQVTEQVLDLSASPSDAAVWGEAVWGVDVWGGQSTPDSRLAPGNGIGQVVALLVTGEVTDRTTYLMSSLYGEMGGML